MRSTLWQLDSGVHSAKRYTRQVYAPAARIMLLLCEFLWYHVPCLWQFEREECGWFGILFARNGNLELYKAF